MYIKKIIIEGFKSFGERTVVGPFDSGHNVIGRNGSGKSNFFAAIQFVLSDDFSRLQAAQRHALLHEGSGPVVITATVEIIFDNSDKRIPIDKTEVSLRRVIGAKKDQYILNKNIVNRSEVVSLLESAGFSRSNPYYIIQQGKVNELAKTPESRLTLLQEIAGVKVYEDKRNESISILKDTQLKINNIEELLDTINKKLETLEDETKEFKQYQQWHKKMRTIEYILYERELLNNKKNLEKLKIHHANLSKEQAELESDVQKIEFKIKSINKNLKRAQRDAEIAEEEKDNLSKEIEQLLVEKELYKLKKIELMQDINQDNENQKRINDELNVLNKEIEMKQAELGIIKPQYDDAVIQEKGIIRQLDSQEQERQVLYARQGRGAQFQSKEERNAWIEEELVAVNKQIEEKVIHIKDLEKDINENEQRLSELEKTKHNFFNDMEHQYSAINGFHKQYIEINKKKDELLSQKKELYKSENDLQKDLAPLEEDLKKVNQHLISLFGKGIFNGINSVHRVLEIFKERHDIVDELPQYYGLVIECFSCHSDIYKAVEVTAGSRLFYHIIATSKFGGEILKEMNAQQLPGVVSFMPLDRLKIANMAYPIFEYAVPLITNLKFDQIFEVPLRHIFERTIISRDLKVGTEIANKYRFDCVTLEGDQVSSKGWLKGGHFGHSKSPMKMLDEKQNLTKEIEKVKEKIIIMQQEIQYVDKNITSVISELQQIENKRSKARDTYDRLTNDLNILKEQLQMVKNNQVLHHKNLLKLKLDLSVLNTLKTNLEKELEQDLTYELTAADQQKIDNLNDSIAQLSKDLKNVFKRRGTLEKEKNELENLLNKNLICKKDELEDKLRKIRLDDKELTLQEYEDHYSQIQDRIKKCEDDLEIYKTRYKDIYKQKQEKLNEREQYYVELKPKQEDLEEISKKIGKLSSKIRILDESVKDLIKKMAEHDLIPNNNLYSKFLKENTQRLYKKLDDCRKNLNDRRYVNQKAMDQYQIFKNHRNNLCKRKGELDRSTNKILELLEFLQQRKYEAVEITFKQVSKYFSEIFSKIVPRGKAQLVMQKGNLRDENESMTSTSLDFDNIIGVGIRVSFTGHTSAMRDYNQLSGGQKSLLALTLIFAIQKCDPAPFYLFDEIDQALDTAHRRVVAQMIHELSSEAQFITTTFRPELLEHANQFYHVRFQNKMSYIHEVTREQALEFVEPNDTE